MKKLISTITALVLASAPVFALAEEGAGTSVETSATVETSSVGTNVRAEKQAQLQVERVKRETELKEKRDTEEATKNERKTELEAKKVEWQHDLIAKAKERADREIDRRIEGLEHIADRIEDMRRLSGDSRASLIATLTAEIEKLSALRAEIVADTSTTTLRVAISSITKSYRIFALIMPKAAVMAAADRVLSVAAQLEQFSAKLAERIAGNADTSLSVALAEANAKIADAKAKANAAVEKVKALMPDNGDEALFQANKAAIREAHAMVQEAQKLLQETHRTMADIAKNLRAASASSGTTAGTPSGTE